MDTINELKDTAQTRIDIIKKQLESLYGLYGLDKLKDASVLLSDLISDLCTVIEEGKS